MNVTFLEFVKPFADEFEPAVERALNEVTMRNRCTACVHGFPRQDWRRECKLALNTERHKDCASFKPFLRVALREYKALLGAVRGIPASWDDVAARIARHIEGMTPNRPRAAIDSWVYGGRAPSVLYRAALLKELSSIFSEYVDRQEAVFDELKSLKKIGRFK